MDRDTFLVVMAIGCGLIVTLSFMMFASPGPETVAHQKRQTVQERKLSRPASTDDQLVTGDEPIQELLIKSGCAVCHTIPGVPAARGREGPPLILGHTGATRLADPNYRGSATTVREYIMESILDPGAYIVPGYSDRVMPRWYGQKLNAKALNRMVSYLETLTSS